jgi:RHS repeat-associated protein
LKTNNWVYFDDFKITHTKTNVVQYNEYYPFGLTTANSWTRENTTGNQFLYNGGTEFNPTTSTYDLHYRGYDPILGRMNQVDPLASKYASMTPYNYAFNSPTVINDPLGDDPGSSARCSWCLGDKPRPIDTGNGSGGGGGYGGGYQGGGSVVNPGFSEETWAKIGGIVNDLWNTAGASADGTATWTNDGSDHARVSFLMAHEGSVYSVMANMYKGSVIGLFASRSNIRGVQLSNLVTLMAATDQQGSDQQLTSAGPIQAGFGLGELLASTELGIAALKPTFDAAAYFGRLNGGVGTVPLHLKKNIFLPYDIRVNNALQIGRINSSTAIKVGNTFGKVATTFAIAGLLTTAYDIGKDGQLTAGDAFQAANTALMVAFPVYGVFYGVTDLGFAVFSGTSLTDRVKSGIDSKVSGSVALPGF